MRLVILFSVSLIFSIGLMMVFNTSSAEILDRALNVSLYHALLRQLIYAFIGCIMGALFWFLGYKSLLKLSWLFLGLGTLLLLLVFVPGIGKMRNGSHRWIGVGSLTFQPSEFVKLLLPLAYIKSLTRQPEIGTNFWKFLRLNLLLIVPTLLVLIEPDHGTAVVMGSSLLPLFFLSGVRWKFWALPMLLALLIGGYFAYQVPYVRARLNVYFHPESDLKGKGHQPHQAKIAAGSGMVFGKGPGGSLQKLTYLPEAQNDYIAAIYAEEFGFIGMLSLIVLYMLIAFGGGMIALHAPEREGAWVAVAMTFLIIWQAFLNLGVVSGLLPSKGVNLPFFSQGGTSLLANMMALSLLLQVGSYSERQEKNYPSGRRRYRGSSLSGTGTR